MILVTGGAGFIVGNYAIRHFKNNAKDLAGLSWGEAPKF